MTFSLEREPSTPDGMFGRLALDGVFFCWTLEPAADRDEHPAIPAGTYRVIISESARFGRRLPAILGVPGRSGVRIHPGNFDQDTEGCVLLGTSRHGAMLENSRAACQMFQSRLEFMLARGETIALQISDAPKVVQT